MPFRRAETSPGFRNAAKLELEKFAWYDNSRISIILSAASFRVDRPIIIIVTCGICMLMHVNAWTLFRTHGILRYIWYVLYILEYYLFSSTQNKIATSGQDVDDFY